MPSYRFTPSFLFQASLCVIVDFSSLRQTIFGRLSQFIAKRISFSFPFLELCCGRNTLVRPVYCHSFLHRLQPPRPLFRLFPSLIVHRRFESASLYVELPFLLNHEQGKFNAASTEEYLDNRLHRRRPLLPHHHIHRSGTLPVTLLPVVQN